MIISRKRIVRPAAVAIVLGPVIGAHCFSANHLLVQITVHLEAACQGVCLGRGQPGKYQVRLPMVWIPIVEGLPHAAARTCLPTSQDA